jgi:hypothetical protein
MPKDLVCKVWVLGPVHTGADAKRSHCTRNVLSGARPSSPAIVTIYYFAENLALAYNSSLRPEPRRTRFYTV